MRRIVFVCGLFLIAVTPCNGDAGPRPFEWGAGVKLTTPQWLSGSVVYFIPTGLDWCDVAIQAEPGLAGGKFQVGIGHAIGYWGGALGYAVKVSALQTWGDPLWCEPDQTYVGLEAEIMVIFVNANLGIYGRVAGDAADQDVLVSGGIGLGF